MSDVARLSITSRKAELPSLALALASPVPFVILEPFCSFVGQLLLALAASAFVALYLYRGDAEYRAQVAIVVCCAMAVEFTGTHILHTWNYRLGNLPPWVAPGHAAMFTSTTAVSRTLAPKLPNVWTLRFTIAASAAWTLWGLFISERTDVTGLLLLAAIAATRTHPRLGPRVPYIVFFTLFCECLGVSAGLYEYHAHDVTGLLSMGTVPAGLPGGYLLIDWVALQLAPHLIRAFATARSGRGRTLPEP